MAMATPYERDDVRRVLRLHASPANTVNDLLEAMNRQAAEGMWAYSTVIDARAPGLVPASHDELWSLANHAKTLALVHGRRGRVAVVVADALLTAVARMYAVLTNDTRLSVAVFTDPEEAERWALRPGIGDDSESPTP